MRIKLSVIKTKLCGLEVYRVYYGRHLVSQHMSREYAMSAFKKLEIKLNQAA